MHFAVVVAGLSTSMEFQVQVVFQLEWHCLVVFLLFLLFVVNSHIIFFLFINVALVEESLKGLVWVLLESSRDNDESTFDNTAIPEANEQIGLEVVGGLERGRTGEQVYTLRG